MKILIIEDDEIWMLKHQMMIEQFEYEIIGQCRTVHDAKKVLVEQKPNIILCDIMLLDGTAFELSVWFEQIPTVFMTSFPKREYQEKILHYPNSAFLVKPFHYLTLKAAIESLCKDLVIIPQKEEGGIEVVGKLRLKKVIPFNEIIWVEADGNYLTINTQDKKYTLKNSLIKLGIENHKDFVRVQKSFVVNLRYIQKIDLGRSLININGISIPIGRNYRKNLLETYEKIN